MNLLLSLLKHKNHYYAELPYNLNWQIKDVAPFRSFLRDNPISVVDIGARGGITGELANLQSCISYCAFEADPAECRRLQDHPPGGFHSYRVYPYFIGDKIGDVDFHLYHHAGVSSLLKPDQRFSKYFTGPAFHIERTVRVNSVMLDHVMEMEKIPSPDFIKLDTQGTELNILQSSPNALSNALLVEVEVEFLPIYEGQSLFHDVCGFMYKQGFELLYVNRVFGQRTVYRGDSRGQLIFGDALFGRREDHLNGMDIRKISKYAFLLVNYGHIDISYHLCSLYPEILNVIPQIRGCFKAPRYRKLRSVKRFLIQQIDKLLCLILHWRKTNADNCDSDRCWPFR